MADYESTLGRIAASRSELALPISVERQQKGRDLVPTAFITPREVVDENGDPLAVTKSGPVRTIPYDPSEVEATVNLIINPFWTGLSHWGSDLGTRTLVGRSIVVASAGSSASLNCYTSSSTRIPFVAGTVLTASFWVANNTGKPCNYTVRFRQFNSAGTNIGDKASLLMTLAVGERKRVTFTGTADTNAVTMFMVFTIVTADGTNIPSGDGFELWEPQVELGNVVHPFVDPMEKYVYWLGNVGGSPTARFPEHPDRYQEATKNFDTNPISIATKRSVNAVPGTSSSRIDNAGLDHPTAGRIDTATRVTVTANLAEITWIGKPFTVTPVVGDTFSSQVWFRVSKGLIGKTVQYRLSKNGGTSEHAFVVSLIATGEWQYFRNVINVTTTGGTGMFDYLVFPDAVGNASFVGEYVDFTATQLEKKPYSTPLVDINSPDVIWDGVAFASASSRPTREDPLRGVGDFIEEGTTNLCINPSLETNTNGWAFTYGGGSEFSEFAGRTNIDAYVGSYCARRRYIRASGRGSQGPSVSGGGAIGNSYAISLYIKGTPGDKYQFGSYVTYADGNANGAGGKIIVASGMWERVTWMCNTASDREMTSFVPTMLSTVDNAGSVTDLFMDGLQVELKGYHTSLAIGDMGSGYSWSGTAHASSSVRVGSEKSVTMLHSLDHRMGSIYYRILVLEGYELSGYILSSGNYNTPWFFIRSRGDSYLRNPALLNSLFPNNPLPSVGYIGEMLAWDEWNLVSARGSGRFVLPRLLRDMSGSFPNKILRIGNVTQNKNFVMAASIVFDRLLSDAEFKYLDSIPTHALTFENVRRVDFWESDDG